MPKIIENIKDKLLAEAKRQITEQGYGKTTVRSVASACGVGVGTVYNYFESKDMLIASFVLSDWMECLEKMRTQISPDPRITLASVYNGLCEFIHRNKALFEDADAIKSFNSSHLSRHALLRGQIASMIYPVCNKTADDRAFLSEFIAESLLSWTLEGRDFDQIYSDKNALSSAVLLHTGYIIEAI